MTQDPENRISSETRSPEMSWEKLDRMDWQLWLLASLLIFVLGAGLLTFMFPSAFWLKEGLGVTAPQRAFFGFCVLLALVLVYLVQKQAKVRQLRRELFDAQADLAIAEREAAIESFQTLPTMNQFRDALAMEFRRATTSEVPLSVVLFKAHFASLERLGHMARCVRSLLRQGETLYRISDKAIGVILPGMNLSKGASFAAQAEALSGPFPENLEVNVTAYPDEASTLSALEANLRRQDGNDRRPLESLLALQRP